MKNTKKIVTAGLLFLGVMYMVSPYDMYGWTWGGSSAHEEVDTRNESTSEGGEKQGLASSAKSFADAAAELRRQQEGGDTKTDEKTDVRDDSSASDLSGGVDLSSTSLTTTLKLDADSRAAIKALSEGSMGDSLKVFKENFEQLQTDRDSSGLFSSMFGGKKETFITDVLDRVSKSGSLTGQDLIDLKQSLSLFTDAVQQLGDPLSGLDPQVRLDIRQQLSDAYGGDLGQGMRKLSRDVSEAFKQLPLEGAGIDPAEIDTITQGLKDLEDASTDGRAFKKATFGRGARDFADQAEMLSEGMKEKYDSWIATMKKVLVALVAVAAVVAVAVALPYIIIAVKAILIVGALGGIGYGCYKSPGTCEAILKNTWTGIKSAASWVGEKLAGGLDASSVDPNDFE